MVTSNPFLSPSHCFSFSVSLPLLHLFSFFNFFSSSKLTFLLLFLFFTPGGNDNLLFCQPIHCHCFTTIQDFFSFPFWSSQLTISESERERFKREPFSFPLFPFLHTLVRLHSNRKRTWMRCLKRIQTAVETERKRNRQGANVPSFPSFDPFGEGEKSSFQKRGIERKREKKEDQGKKGEGKLRLGSWPEARSSSSSSSSCKWAAWM